MVNIWKIKLLKRRELQQSTKSVESINLITATGERLDNFGRSLGIYRTNTTYEPDDTYRKSILREVRDKLAHMSSSQISSNGSKALAALCGLENLETFVKGGNFGSLALDDAHRFHYKFVELVYNLLQGNLTVR